jgi:hypothetical protein
MKKFITAVFAGSLVATSAIAGEFALGENFVVTHPTEISSIGAFNGDAPFTYTETVGIFSDLTGSLVGPEVTFGPGSKGTQLGNTFFESFPIFELLPGDYSIISISTSGSLPNGSGGSLSGGNSYQNLGFDLTVPGGGRFDSGTGLTVSTSPGTGSGAGSHADVNVVDPVPDGGLTAVLLGASFAGLGWVRRKF